ncbi:hypothetical protein MTX71_07935 [Pseudomonas aeruginosa]|uniref:hypothetical protein n=1 Tax=Pseudomonas aeruginosa TaxID=287 RepID=UPI00216A006C|nr:hypothetical protein [Pseudomonas aeruginosa]UVW76826.1 hypothetical protein MTX71_07935 [Pseudomonas aeruginosa]
MTKANECTCPSGDGSLRHPCPAHPAVEQAGGDERDLQGTQGERDGWGPFPIVQVPWNVFDRAVMWVEDRRRYGDDGTIVDDWKALKTIQRAALAQPSPTPELPERGTQHRFSTNEQNCRHDFAGVWWNDNGETKTGRECRHCGFFVADVAEAAAEQAEAERPEVVAWRYGSSGGIVSDKACLDEWKSGGEYQSLMTVAQHERIVKAWIERWKAYIELSAKIAAQRDAADARLHEVATACATAEQERDAALARTAELAQALRHLLHNIKASGKRIDLGLAKECAEAALARIDSTAPSQAQHSVPEGFREKFKQCMELAFAEIAFYVSPEKARNPNSRARKASALATELLDMLAAAPGTEVPQAWLDVQAERRRQITAEGWTPDHDDLYCAAELPRAAAAYILSGANDEAPAIWPFVAKWWKPRDARANYVRAGALILAEIERLDRAAAPGKEGV